MNITAKYKTWQDLAKNVGIQCEQCKRCHWNNANYEVADIDPTTAQICSNCVVIKQENVVKKEQQILDEMYKKKKDEDEILKVFPYTYMT